MSEKPKPCPWCNCTDLRVRETKLGYRVVCRQCGAIGPRAHFTCHPIDTEERIETKRAAWQFWDARAEPANRRPTPAEPGQEGREKEQQSQ